MFNPKFDLPFVPFMLVLILALVSVVGVLDYLDQVTDLSSRLDSPCSCGWWVTEGVHYSCDHPDCPTVRQAR